MMCSEFRESRVRSASDLVQASLNRSDCSCEAPGRGSRAPALRTLNGLSPNDTVAAPLFSALRDGSGFIQGFVGILGVGSDRGSLVRLSPERVRQSCHADRGEKLRPQSGTWGWVRFCYSVLKFRVEIGGVIVELRIDQHHPRYFVRVAAGVYLRVIAAERVTDQHVRTFDPGLVQQSV